MRVILTNDVTHNTSRFFVRLVPGVAHFIHGIEHTTVNRLQTIPDVRKGAADYDTHCIVHVGLTHFVFNIYREYGTGYVRIRHTTLGNFKGSWRPF